MAARERLAALYRPTHDEMARQMFVGTLKGLLNGPVEARIAADYEQRIAPAFVEAHGREPTLREEVAQAFEASHGYQLWGASVFESQNLMWDTVDETCQRLLPELTHRFEALDAAQCVGSLALDDALVLPEPIRSVEIHRQPGGYFGEPDKHGLLTGLRYFGTVELYRAAKGLSSGAAAGEPGMGNFVVAALQRRFPEFAATRVLDLGCGPGTETIAYKRAFQDAEVWGVDLSAPFLRFAHLWAEDQSTALHFRQADARRTGFDDASFDLIVSNILFHETGDDILPGILEETRRLLAPGGVMLHVDVPYQIGRTPIPRQQTNHWQIAHNGEPYWGGFSAMDIRAALLAAGFSESEIFVDYDPIGVGDMLVFGARRDA